MSQWQYLDDLEVALIADAFQWIDDDHPFVVFDVGANSGEWTACVLSQTQRNTTSHAFEISARMIPRLRQRFSGDDRVVINHMGLSDTPGLAEFKQYENNDQFNTLNLDASYWDRRVPSVTQTVEVTTGDAYCEQHGISHIDLLKVDTEGWEWPILHGFERMLKEKRIAIVQFEYGYVTADLHVVMKDFFRYFESVGYRVGRPSIEGLDFSPFRYSDNDFTSGPNYVAVRNA